MFWETRATALIGTLLVSLATLGGCKQGSVPAVNVAEAQAGTDITPRAEVPEVARLLSQAFATAADVIRPSVVRVDVESSSNANSLTQGPGQAVPPGLEEFFHRFFGSPGRGMPPPIPQRGTGSGVVIDAEGHVLTNSHVVEGAEKVTIQLVDLSPGDVILEVDRQRVRTAEEAAARLAANGDKPHLLRVRNAQGTRFVTVSPSG